MCKGHGVGMEFVRARAVSVAMCGHRPTDRVGTMWLVEDGVASGGKK